MLTEEQITELVYKEFPIQHDEHLYCSTKKKKIEQLRRNYRGYLIRKMERDERQTEKRFYSGSETGKRSF